MRELSSPLHGVNSQEGFHHTQTHFFYTQVSEFNTADMIPLLFKGKIFPFISRPLYIITQSKLRAELHSDAVAQRQNK